MEDPQSASAFFFVPVAVAYALACGGWLWYDKLRGLRALEPTLDQSNRPVLDFALALAAAGAILALGSAFRRDWLLPGGDSSLGRLFWIVDNAIIYSPMAIVLVARRQGLSSLFLSRSRLAEKSLLGLGLGVVAVGIYLAMRGELAQFAACLSAAVAVDKLVNFPAIFLEGVAVAFGFVRLRWLVGNVWALLIPCALFAAAHIPSAMENQRTLFEIAAFFVFNTSLAAAIFWTVQRSRDVVWIGLVHYLMDIAIRAI